MTQNRKDLNILIYKYLEEKGFKTTAKSLVEEGKIDVSQAAKTSNELGNIFSFEQEPSSSSSSSAALAPINPTPAAKKQSSSSKSEEQPAKKAKVVPPPAQVKVSSI